MDRGEKNINDNSILQVTYETAYLTLQEVDMCCFVERLVPREVLDQGLDAL